MKGPSKALLSIEGIRAMYEYTLGIVLCAPLKYICSKGDGHPVIVIPGLGTSDGSTTYIRTFLTDLGYNAHSWGMGRNIGPRKGLEVLLDQLVKRVDTIYQDSGNQPVSLIGWSLGGIYAREIAKRVPDKIRQVITLGTPFKAAAGGTNAEFLYEILSKDKSHKNPDVIKTISEPPPVPFTSIYSKTDGIVHWQCSIEDPSNISENIEIPGASHLGLGHNPVSMFVVANRLAQTRENWQPYNR